MADSGPLRSVWALAFVLALTSGAHQVHAQQRITLSDVGVRDVIRAIERDTEWHFLYRDALVSGRTISVDAPLEDAVAALDTQLRPLGLELVIDENRRQVLVHATKETPVREGLVSGRVLDAETGSALPFATITWVEDGELRGVAADRSGYFGLRVQEGTDPRQVNISYIGYDPTTVSLPNDLSARDLAVRLRPRPVVGSEVIVSGTMLSTDLDTTWHRLLKPGSMSPLGENGLIRSLQALPSVAITPGLSDGLTVRGSQPDGFQVLLDGIPVYSQSHLFGLFDAFNDDALQAVGLFYGIAPASYQAPPGGTLSFITRSGSSSESRGSVAVSNTSVRATAEGPLPGGSWLLSGRVSLLSAMDFLGGTDLVAVGLDLGRATSEVTTGTQLHSGGLRLIGEPDALYHDWHLRADLEGRDGARFSASGYLGGDHAGYAASRFVRIPGQGNGPPAVESISAGTDSRWGTGNLSLQYLRPLESGGIASSLGGFTRYYSRYRKDDYVYKGRATPLPGGGPMPNGAAAARVAPYANYSRLVQTRLAQDWSRVGPSTLAVTSGVSVDAYVMHLEEESLDRNPFSLDRNAVQVDAFGGIATERGRDLGGEIGLRVHYFGLGRRVVLSPRVRLTAGEGHLFSASIGYSRNHQFLHRISLEHEGFTDLWVVSGPDEQPTRVDHVTAGVNLRPVEGLSVQIEAYAKKLRYVRLHQTVVEARGLLTGSQLLRPWLSDADGSSRGVEVMARHALGRAVLTHGYTWSRSVLSHRGILSGDEFAAPWDRRHQYTVSLRRPIGSHLDFTASWMFATGLPNSLWFSDPAESPRLSSYDRLDLTIDWAVAVPHGSLDIRFGAFNVYDRDNTWYRALVPVTIASDRTGRLVDAASVDVYDLGFEPSIEIRYRF